MSDICEKCGCPDGVDGHDVLYREIDELKKAAPNALNNLSKALGSMDAEERSVLCARITELEGRLAKVVGVVEEFHREACVERWQDGMIQAEAMLATIREVHKS